jgi:pimeloyl-ACP methyl ester carboxylesterase
VIHDDRPPTAVDDGFFATIDGVDQWVTMRGRDVRKAVLLMIHGTGYALSQMAPVFEPWEEHFTLVQWDQPGAGATWARNRAAAADSLTLDRLARDGIAVAELTRRRFASSPIILVAISGGTIVGLKMIKQRPDLFSAYVGSGQVVNWRRQEALSYVMLLAQARSRGDATAIAELEQLGPPPYESVDGDAIKAKYAAALTPAEQAAFAGIGSDALAAMRTPPADARYIARGLDPFDARRVSMSTFERLRPQITAFDASELGLKYDVPMFFVQGASDVYTVTSEVAAYAAAIEAPASRLIVIDGAGHSPIFMRDEFLRLLLAHIADVARRP